jgi:hypothetical protein
MAPSIRAARLATGLRTSTCGVIYQHRKCACTIVSASHLSIPLSMQAMRCASNVQRPSHQVPQLPT